MTSLKDLSILPIDYEGESSPPYLKYEKSHVILELDAILEQADLSSYLDFLWIEEKNVKLVTG